MTSDEDLFRRSYAFMLRRYLRRETEDMLHAAYELGREAVLGGFTVLDVAHAHHAALASAARGADGHEDASGMIERSGALLLESLAAFEMVRRGVGEAQAAVAEERLRARILRRLSAVLGDASLAADADGSLEEMLRVVAEQARELTAADSCRVRLDAAAPPGVSVSANAASWDDAAATGWAGLRPASDRARPVGAGRERLIEPLTALDGRRLGELEATALPGRRFGELDRAVLRHVAQMASAAVERLALHRRPAQPAGPSG